MMNKILIAGGTGFIGKNLIPFLVEKGYSVHLLTRKPNTVSSEKVRYFQWDVKNHYIDRKAFEGVDTIINLTGANIGEKRWTKERKAEIINSRVQSANLLYEHVAASKNGIHTFISSSAVGFYGAVTTGEVFE